MFAVCSSWFEIDERKWTYYQHGSHNDWELGAKTTTVPASKVLDNEWYCLLIRKLPQRHFWFILRVTHGIRVALIFFLVCVSGTPQFTHAFIRCCSLLSMASLNILLLTIKCAIFLKSLYRVFDCYILGGLQYMCKIFARFTCVFINPKSITADF